MSTTTMWLIFAAVAVAAVAGLFGVWWRLKVALDQDPGIPARPAGGR